MSDMIRIKKKNYIEERTKESFNNINNQLKSSGGFSINRHEEKWRGKNSTKNCINLTEDHYQLKQILKGYQNSKDELKGYNSKYINQLTDLLYKKDKNFTKKRFELYSNRINNKEHKDSILNSDKNHERPYRTTSRLNSRLDRMFHSKKHESVNMYNTSRLNSHKINSNIPIHNTINSCWARNRSRLSTPSEMKSIKYILHNNSINKSKIARSIILSHLGTKEDDSFDTSLKGKEEFLVSGDKEKYQEYLSKEYKFILSPNINHVIYLFEKNQRTKNYKNVPNSKFLEFKKISIKNEFVNKIKKKNKTINLNIPNILSKYRGNPYKMKLTDLSRKSKARFNFINDCKKILINVKNNLN
jgi:hypothetical protein